MNGIDEEVRDALEVWRHDGQEPDWDDVLVRARAARPRPRREARRLRAALALVVLAGLAVLATPALGISQRLGTFVGLRSAAKPGLVLTATLKSAAAQGTARLTLETSRVGIAARTGGRNAVPFVPVSPGRLLRRSAVRWQLTFTGISGRARDATLSFAVPGKRADVLTLCAPCDSGARGSFRLTRARLTALFNGSARAQLRAEDGTSLGGSFQLTRP